jgi:UDP:flavonoid glycosyltransferase YjiC (YdhE family)
MARFLITTGPYPGHIAPSIPIVQKLVEGGHEIVWITGREYKEKVESTGARFHPLPKESDPDGMEIYDWHTELKKLTRLAQIKYWVKHIFLDSCARDMQTVELVLKDFPANALVGDTVTLAPYFISEIDGTPSAEISLLPLCLLSRDTAPFGVGLLPARRRTKWRWPRESNGWGPAST